jgi:hypothetical protein
MLWDYERHGGLAGMLLSGKNHWDLGESWGRLLGSWGTESGIADPFLSWAPWGVGFPQAASTGDTWMLEFGNLTTRGV